MHIFNTQKRIHDSTFFHEVEKFVNFFFLLICAREISQKRIKTRDKTFEGKIRLGTAVLWKWLPP